VPQLPPSEQDWVRDKARFLADTLTRDHGARLGPLAQQFATLTYSLLDADTVAQVLEQVVHAARRIVPHADLVSITLRSPDGTLTTPVHTDPLAIELDQIQYDYTEGPCLDAAQPTGPAHATSPNLANEPNWPRFGPAAAHRGIHALLSTALLPITPPPRQTGALNIYATTPHTFTETDHATTLLLATHASLALARTHAATTTQLHTEHLRRAIDSRDVIGQAKGILMTRRGLSPDAAFDLLRHTSQDLNIKLVELAETITTHHTQLDEPEH
jgi:GAF domain-containing protein